jgi:hypothetical protein
MNSGHKFPLRFLLTAICVPFLFYPLALLQAAFFTILPAFLLCCIVGWTLLFVAVLYCLQNWKQIQWFDWIPLVLLVCMPLLVMKYPQLWPSRLQNGLSGTQFTGYLLIALLWIAVFSWKSPQWIEYLGSCKPIQSLHHIVQAHHSAILIAIGLTGIYFFLAMMIQSPQIRLVDVYFAADNTFWLNYLGLDFSQSQVMRATHPFAYLLLRPAVWLISGLFAGDRSYGLFLLVAIGGGLSTLMFWKLIRRLTGSQHQASLLTILFGLTSSQLIFSSFTETYVFSALGLVTFLYLVVSQSRQIFQIAAGAFVFGITITNFIQAGLAKLIIHFNFKKLLDFLVKVIPVCFLLTLLSKFFYPNSMSFWNLNQLMAEENFLFSPFGMPVWKAIGRISSLIKTLFLFDVLGPTPRVLNQGRPDAAIHFFSITPGVYSISAYPRIFVPVVALWILIMAGSVLFLVLDIRRKKLDRMHWQIVLFCCLTLLFNLGMHTQYGFEMFLYSPDFTYALLILVLVPYLPYLNTKIATWVEGIFLAGLLATNIFFMYQFLGLIVTDILPVH